MTISVVDDTMECTVGDHDHIAGPYRKRLTGLFPYYHVPTTLDEEVDFFLPGMPMATGLLITIQPCRTQHEIIEVVIVPEHIDFRVLDYFAADVMYVIFLHLNISSVLCR